VRQLPVDAMSNGDAAGMDVRCCCEWRCQNLPDASREEKNRTGQVRVVKDAETNIWRCHLILKVQPSQPTHNFSVLNEL